MTRLNSLNAQSTNQQVRQSKSILYVLLGMAFSALMPLPVEPSFAQPDDTVAPSYRLGAEDVLEISVWKDEALSRPVVVRPDGFISFPLVGEVLAEGKTVDQFTEGFKARLSRYVPNPTVTVTVSQINSYKIYVIGKVNRPGEFLVGHHTDVMQALSLAGGLTPFASQGNIKILRRIHDQQLVFAFDYGDVLGGDDLEQNIILDRWDVVMVP